MATPLIGIDLGGAYAGAVHQDRLVLIGSSAISDLVLASKIGGDRTDFRLASTDATRARAAVPSATPPVTARLAYAGGEAVVDPENPPVDENGDARDFTATDSDGFWFQQTSSRSNTFHATIQQEGLFIFGDLGEANVPAGPFNANEVVIRENSWYGTEIGRTVLIVGGLIVFIQKGGHDIRGVNWSEQDRKYVAPSLLTLSGNLFDRAVDMSFAPSRDRRSDTIYLVGESDNEVLNGQLAVMLLRHQEPFYAWSRWHTEGRIIGGASPLGNRCFLVERNGVVGLETLDTDETDSLDAAVVVSTAAAPARDGGGAYIRYQRLPREAQYLDGLTDLDGLEFWHIDKGEPPFEQGRGTVTVTERSEIERRNELQVADDEPVLRVDNGLVQERYLDEAGELAWRRLPVPNQDLDAFADGRVSGVLGFGYTRSVETLPFVARKQTGTSTRLRPARVMEVVTDMILPAGLQIPVGVDRSVLEQLLRIGETTVSLVSVSRGRGREREIRRAPRLRRLDTSQIVSCRYGGRAGFRDRLAVKVESTRHIVLAGLAYRAVS